MDNFRNKCRQGNTNQPAFEPETNEISKVKKLVTQVVNGNADAFGELYIIFVEKIYRYVFYHVKSKTFAEDITEEVFTMVMTEVGVEVALKDADGRVSAVAERLRNCAKLASETQRYLPPSFVGELENCIKLLSELQRGVGLKPWYVGGKLLRG